MRTVPFDRSLYIQLSIGRPIVTIALSCTIF